MGTVSRAAETWGQLRCKHTPHPPPPRFMYLLNSGAETLFVVPGVPKQLILPSATSDSKTIKREMDGKMQPPSGVGGMGGRKRQNLTLDLNSASPKKNKVQNLLTSPDVQMLKLTSPELEKFLSQNPSLATLTPNNPLSRPNSGASGSYDSDTYQLPEGSVAVKIKDEPDDRSVDDEDEEESLLSPGGAGVSPID